MAADTATLTALRARVLAATGPDRGLDADICVALGYRDLPPAPEGALTAPIIVKQGDGNSYLADAPALTGSIDAAAALVERMLPGVPLLLSTLGNADNQSVAVLYLSSGPTAEPKEIGESAFNGASAILAALLSALIDREGDHDR